MVRGGRRPIPTPPPKGAGKGRQPYTNPAGSVRSHEGPTPGERRSTRNRSTVRSGSGKTRTITINSAPTTLSGKGVTSHPQAAANRIQTHVDAALARVEAAYAAPGKNKSSPDLTAEENKNLDTVLQVARKSGATKREKLAAVETGIVESGFHNFGAHGEDGGDADSAGWRQERQSQYGPAGTPGGPTDVKASAKRFFQEIKTEGAGAPTPGLAAQGTQGSAHPERYDAVEAQARGLLKYGGKSGPKPAKKDLETLRRAGVSPRPTGGAAAPAAKEKVDTKTPYSKAVKKAGRSKHPERLINPKWDPDSDSHSTTILAKGISPVVKKWSKKYGVTVGEAKADSGHVSPGHLQTGTATDVYPSQDTEAGWNRLEQGLAVLAASGFEVGYDASRVPGTQSWANHGRNNHAHIEWSGQGSASDAMSVLGGITNARADRLAKRSGYGSVGGTSSAAAVSAYASATGVSKRTAQKVRQSDPEKFKNVVQKALARVRAAYADSEASANTLTRPEPVRRHEA